jgi:hypothetical protein
MAAVRRVTAASHDHFNATAFVETTIPAPRGDGNSVLVVSLMHGVAFHPR